MNRQIKVGFCVAYDWRLLEHALPAIYAHADLICLSLDQKRRSWSGKPFNFDDAAFHSFYKNMDRDKKIVIFEDDFYQPELSPGQNEVRQRNLMAMKMGAGGWHIQIDCDEYFLDFKGFVNYLNSIAPSTGHFNVCCPLVTLIKRLEQGFLYVGPSSAQQLEFIQIATTNPFYEYGRRNGYFNILTNFLIVHQSWARSDNEILQKLTSWGHTLDFNKEKYFGFWQSLNKENYKGARNFHPTKPELWPSLNYQEADSVEELLRKFNAEDFPKLSRLQRLLRNSRLVSGIRSASSRLLKK